MGRHEFQVLQNGRHISAEKSGACVIYYSTQETQAGIMQKTDQL